MFDNLHLDLFPIIFDYLTQRELLDYSIICRLFADMIDKYIQNTDFRKVELNKELKYACKDNLIISIKQAKRPDFDWNWALYGAAAGGHLNLVKYAIDNKEADDFEEALNMACQYGQINIYDYLQEIIRKTEAGYICDLPELLSDLLYHAGYGGQEKIISERLMDLTNSTVENFNSGLIGAVSGGHIHLVKIMKEYGANNFDKGLFEAAYKGHIDIVKYFIDNGLVSFNLFETAFENACMRKHTNVMNYLLNFIGNKSTICANCNQSISNHFADADAIAN